jgi:hypothetical protein
VADRDIRLIPFVKRDRRADWLAAAGDTVAIAITLLPGDAASADSAPLLSRVAWVVPGSKRARISYQRDSLRVTSLAIRDTLALATVTSAAGVRDVIAVPLGRR